MQNNDIASLQEALDTYGNMTYDEIKEKSHDVAWRATAKDYAISLEDIAREAGLDSEDISYITENVQLQLAVNWHKKKLIYISNR